MDPVARSEFTTIGANGKRFTVEVAIGRPYLRPGQADSWGCPVSLKPLYEKLADQSGGDAVQSLCLAIGLALRLLEGFREEGGRLEFDDGTEMPLDAYLFAGAAKGEGNAV